MKVESKLKKTSFKPITVKVTITSKDEFMALRVMDFDNPIINHLLAKICEEVNCYSVDGYRLR